MHKALKILIISSIFYNFSVGLLTPIFAIFVQHIGGGILEASRAWFLYTILIGVSIVTFGQIEDRISKRKMFLIGRILFTLGAAGYIFVENIEHLYFVQIILAISLAIIDPAFTALFSKSLRKGKESTEWSIWEGAIYIVIALGAIVGGVIASVYGFKALFVVMTISAALSTLTAAMMIRKNMWKALIARFNHIKF
jgi:MFS family permease